MWYPAWSMISNWNYHQEKDHDEAWHHSTGTPSFPSFTGDILILNRVSSVLGFSHSEDTPRVSVLRQAAAQAPTPGKYYATPTCGSFERRGRSFPRAKAIFVHTNSCTSVLRRFTPKDHDHAPVRRLGNLRQRSRSSAYYKPTLNESYSLLCVWRAITHAFPIFVDGNANDDFSSSSSCLGEDTSKRFGNTGEISAFQSRPSNRHGVRGSTPRQFMVLIHREFLNIATWCNTFFRSFPGSSLQEWLDLRFLPMELRMLHELRRVFTIKKQTKWRSTVRDQPNLFDI